MTSTSRPGSFGVFAWTVVGCLAAALALPAAASAGRQSESRPPTQADAKAAPSEPKAAEGAAPTEPVVSEHEKAAEEMARTRADLLAKHQGADEARLTQLMGPPAEKAAKESGLTLVWRGPAGGGDPLPCRLSATLVDGALANLELSGHPSWDRKTCRKFLRPLLQALPWRAVEHGPNDGDGGSASAHVLGNDTIVQMVRDGVATHSILGRVRSQPCRFDLSSNATSALRRSAVPDVVIQAMTERNCS